MDKIKLKRGRKELFFKKLLGHFAVRLKQGKASDEMALESSCGRPKKEVKHVDSATPEKMANFCRQRGCRTGKDHGSTE